jgi:hypothetical protein
MEIKWTDADPETGTRRFIKADRFAGFWTFRYRVKRRGEWTRLHPATVDMWEVVLDALQRRYQRREGVSDDDLKQVQRILSELRAKHGIEEEE